MEVKIGVVYTAKELVLEVEGEADALIDRFDQAVRQGEPILWVTEVKGRRVGVPVDKLAYVEVAGDDETKRVGFGVG